MEQLIIGKTTPNWPNIKVKFNKPIELFVDSLYGFNPNIDTFKILWVKESEEISNFKNIAIKNHEYFDAIISYDEEILNKCKNSYFLPFGTAWVFNYDNNKKKKYQISHLTGFKEITYGHKLRKTVHYNQNLITSPKDFYISKHGGVKNDFSNKIINDVKEPLFESQFHICIENSRQNNFFTEKLIDCLITETVPIYWGCDNIKNFFDVRGFFIAYDFEDIITICNSLNENSYHEKKEFVINNLHLSKKYVTIIDRLEFLINEIIKKWT
jgi:hypothetical protein